MNLHDIVKTYSICYYRRWPCVNVPDLRLVLDLDTYWHKGLAKSLCIVSGYDESVAEGAAPLPY